MNAVRMTVALISTAALTALAGCGDDSSQDASVAFETPGDGASLAGGVQVAMTADGITIEPAGTGSLSPIMRRTSSASRASSAGIRS